MRCLVCVLSVVLLLPAASWALFEETPQDGLKEKKMGANGYLDMVRPVLSSICNFEDSSGNADSNCVACADSLRLLIDSVIEKRAWAVMMADALMKPPAGIMSGTFSFVSHYDQCLNIDDFNTNDLDDITQYKGVPELVRGTFCSIKLRIRRNPLFKKDPNKTLSDLEKFMKKEEHKLDDVYKMMEEFPGFVGLCLPSPCNKAAVEGVGKGVKHLVKSIVDSKGPLPVIIGMDVISCKHRDDVKKINWTIPTRIIVGIFLAMALIVVVGTVVDIIFCYNIDRDDLSKDSSKKHTYDFLMEGDFAEMLRSCSACVSFRRLMDTRVPRSTIKCINGIKFFCIVWIIMGNSGTLRGTNMTTNLKALQKALEERPSQFVLNSQLAIDSIFVVVGVLFAYGLSQKVGIGHVLRYVERRLIKIVPMYLLLLWFISGVFSGLGDGPTWDIESQRYLSQCPTNWWYNVLFINNYLGYKSQCMPHTWIFGFMMQSLVLAVIATFFWKRWENITHFVLGLLVVVTMVNSFALNFNAEVGPTTLLREYSPGTRHGYMNTVGMQLYSRGGPILIGLIIGFIFNQKMHSKQTFTKLNRYALAALWLLIIVVLVLTANATFEWNKGTARASVAVAAVYDCFHRVVWALATGLLIMTCYAGRGGIINMILSWPGFVPISKLTLIIYLLNPFVIFHSNGTTRATQYYTKHLILSEMLWNIVVSIVLSMLVHVLILTPFLAIERYIYVTFINPESDEEDSVDAFTRYEARRDNKIKDPESGESHRSSPGSTNKEQPEAYEDHYKQYDEDETKDKGDKKV